MGVYKIDTDIEYGSILDFPCNDTSSTNSITITPKYLYEFLSSNTDNESIKIILENYFIERLGKMSNQSLENSPFDAIFISDLQADLLNRSNINTLGSLRNKIEDLSDTISFDDGLDD
jgi:hypothetical protein